MAHQIEIANAIQGKLFIVAAHPLFTVSKIALHASSAHLLGSLFLVDIFNGTWKKILE